MKAGIIMITFVLHQLSVARRGEGGEHITLPHPGRRGARRREGQVSRASRGVSSASSLHCACAGV